MLSELCLTENYNLVHSTLSTVQPNISFEGLKEFCFTGVLVGQLKDQLLRERYDTECVLSVMKTTVYFFVVPTVEKSTVYFMHVACAHTKDTCARPREVDHKLCSNLLAL